MEGQRLPTKHQKLEEEKKDSPTDLGASTDLLTPWIWTFGLKDCEIIKISCFKPPGLWCLYSSLRKLILLYKWFLFDQLSNLYWSGWKCLSTFHPFPLVSRDLGTFWMKRLFSEIVMKVSISDAFNYNLKMSSTSSKKIYPKAIWDSKRHWTQRTQLLPQSLIDTQFSLRIAEHYSKIKIITKAGDRMPLCVPLQAWLCQI